MSIADNLWRIREAIETTAHRTNRRWEEIILMGVTKNVVAERIRQAYHTGLRVFGENRVQEFAQKCESLRDLPAAEWHMIGQLQTNKAGRAAELFSHMDSVDSMRLAQKLNAAAFELGRKIPVLIEVNIGAEAAKVGVAPDSPELYELLNCAPSLSSLQFQGLMTVPPYNEDREGSRPHFRKMWTLFDEIGRKRLPAVEMNILSMGMSHDFEIAIEEGANCIRIGTAIFGERPVLRGKN
jgi:PLP dependent protein